MRRWRQLRSGRAGTLIVLDVSAVKQYKGLRSALPTNLNGSAAGLCSTACWNLSAGDPAHSLQDAISALCVCVQLRASAHRQPSSINATSM